MHTTGNYSQSDDSQLEALFRQVVKPAQPTKISLELEKRDYLNPEDSVDAGQQLASL